MIENQKPKRENMLVNIVFNLIVPILILRKGSDWIGEPLGANLGESPDSPIIASIMLAIAVSFPIGYGFWDFIRRRKVNLFSLLGMLNVLLTGGIGMIPGATVGMFAVKEAALPAILGILTVISLRTKRPLVHLFLFNPDIIKVELVKDRLKERNTEEDFHRLMSRCTWMFACSFLMSAFLNYVLSLTLVVTEPAIDKAAYNDEVGRMMGWSFPIIGIPCMIVSFLALNMLMKGIRQHAGLAPEEILYLGKHKDA